MTIFTLTGGQTQFGSAINNTQTDTVNIFGSNNNFVSGGGNLLLAGGNGTPFGWGWDSNTSITLSGATVNDSITLDGGTNAVGGSLSGGSSVSITVGGFNGTAGSNTVNLTNAGGTSNITLGGSGNSVTIAQGATSNVSIGGQGVVTLNGDATNTISFGLGGSTASVGFGGPTDDDNFGYATSISLSGNGNTVTGSTGTAGDENFTITGGGSGNNISLGDGTNSVVLSGTANNITVGGGNNYIVAGSGGDHVTVLGIDSYNLLAFVPEPDDTPAVTASPTDVIVLAGGTNVVTATYENLVVYGAAVTNSNTITALNGNNNVNLGGTGGNTVTLGNGGNGVNVAGDENFITVGDGSNGITTSGNNNNIMVVDTSGTGLDIVQLGTGTNNNVNLGMAGGSVTGWAYTGTTTSVMQSGGRAVTVNLHGGTGSIMLGDGNDNVTANGDSSSILLGNGNNTVQANGNQDQIVAGNGNNNVTANGNQTSVILGDGNNTVTANGSGIGAPPPETIVVGAGNNTIIANGSGTSVATGTHILAGTATGSGNNNITANGNWAQITDGTSGSPNGNLTLSATGSNDTITVNASSTSVDNVTLGSNDVLSVTNGSLTVNAFTSAGDTFHLNALNAGSTLYEGGNNNNTFLGSNASAILHLGAANQNDVITVQGVAGPNPSTYSGNVEISGFTASDRVDLQGLAGLTGGAFTNYASGSAALLSDVLANMTSDATGQTLHLAGGGSIKFDMPVTSYMAGNFASSPSTGIA